MERTLFYATDINPERPRGRRRRASIALDRIKTFTENHQKSGGKSSLSDYYTAAYGRAVFDKTLRSRVVFSDHSLVTDAVFAEMQLISCRNVLIYFDRALQDRAIGLFRDSLARKGFLGLGSKESLRFSEHADAFTEFVREEKIYQRRDHERSSDPRRSSSARRPARCRRCRGSCRLLPADYPLPVLVVVHVPPDRAQPARVRCSRPSAGSR